VAAALVLGAVAGFTLHAPGRSGTWDDVRSWLTFAAVILGVPTALYQLNLQRLQLRDQQNVMKAEAERNKRRDELLDAQLREVEQRATVFERAQAEQVETTLSGVPPVDESVPREDLLWTAIVQNRSGRPVRDVACRLQSHPAQGFGFGAEFAGEVESVGLTLTARVRVLGKARLEQRAALLRGGATVGLMTQTRPLVTERPG
jgi:hypothetical protein